MRTIDWNENGKSLYINPSVVSQEELEVCQDFANAIHNMSDNLLIDFINTNKLVEQMSDLYVGAVVTSSYNQNILAMPYEEFMYIAMNEAVLRGLEDSF